jgi:hypothetical protein
VGFAVFFAFISVLLACLKLRITKATAAKESAALLTRHLLLLLLLLLVL